MARKKVLITGAAGYYGVSDNTRSCWSIVNARKVIGYEPEDDSERVFADEIARFITSNGRTSA